MGLLSGPYNDLSIMSLTESKVYDGNENLWLIISSSYVWVIGLGLGFAACILGSFGNVLVRLSHELESLEKIREVKAGGFVDDGFLQQDKCRQMSINEIDETDHNEIEDGMMKRSFLLNADPKYKREIKRQMLELPNDGTMRWKDPSFEGTANLLKFTSDEWETKDGETQTELSECDFVPRRGAPIRGVPNQSDCATISQPLIQHRSNEGQPDLIRLSLENSYSVVSPNSDPHRLPQFWSFRPKCFTPTVLWWTGMILASGLGPICSAIAVALTPATLFIALAPVGIMFNIALALALLGESLTPMQILGSIFASGGILFLISFCGKYNATWPEIQIWVAEPQSIIGVLAYLALTMTFTIFSIFLIRKNTDIFIGVDVPTVFQARELPPSLHNHHDIDPSVPIDQFSSMSLWSQSSLSQSPMPQSSLSQPQAHLDEKFAFNSGDSSDLGHLDTTTSLLANTPFDGIESDELTVPHELSMGTPPILQTHMLSKSLENP